LTTGRAVTGNLFIDWFDRTGLNRQYFADGDGLLLNDRVVSREPVAIPQTTTPIPAVWWLRPVMMDSLSSFNVHDRTVCATSETRS
jgi:hypothetical protein